MFALILYLVVIGIDTRDDFVLTLYGLKGENIVSEIDYELVEISIKTKFPIGSNIDDFSNFIVEVGGRCKVKSEGLSKCDLTLLDQGLQVFGISFNIIHVNNNIKNIEMKRVWDGT